MTKLKLNILSLAPLLLSACSHNGGWLATVGPDYRAGQPPTAVRWQAPQPEGTSSIAHQGRQADLLQWWDRFQDPALSRLLAAAEKESASVANALARIAQARAKLVGADSGFMPTLDTNLVSKRSSASFGGPPFVWNQHQIGLQSSWEIDLFGGLARQQEAARDQLESRNASWHDARVAVAAEAADAYLGYRYCEIQAQLAKADADSRQASAKLTEIASRNGFRPAADAALSLASAAEGQKALLQQQTQCERSIKGLVAMTGLEETEMRTLLTDAPERLAQLPSPPPFKIDALPANVLLQRPDVAAAERDMAEACANIGVELAKRFPKLSLSGNITPTLQNMNGSAYMLAQTWSIGPTLSLPLFDAGKKTADVDAAQAQYEAAVSSFRGKVRIAAKEVEEALVRLDSAAKRLPHARDADSGYRTNLRAAQTLHRAGLGSLLDVESARRSALSAELAVKELEQERVSAWIALYRAAGGSWEARLVQVENPAPNSEHKEYFTGGNS